MFTDYEKLRRIKQIENASLVKERKMQETLLSIKKKFGKNAILKGLNFEVWIEGGKDRAEAVQKTLRKIASFDVGKPIRLAIKFAGKKTVGIPDKFYTPADSVGNLYCNATTDNHHFGWIQDGAVIDFICDYYTYDGKYIDSYRMLEPITVKGGLTVSDGTLPEGGVRLTYRLTDIYNQAYWTESIDR